MDQMNESNGRQPMIENCHISVIVKFSGQSSRVQGVAYKNPKGYVCHTGHQNTCFEIPNHSEIISDLELLKAELIEFLVLNFNVIEETKTEETLGEIIINIKYSSYNQFGYTLFTPQEANVFRMYSVTVNFAHE
jgi:hypothetical protein